MLPNRNQEDPQANGTAIPVDERGSDLNPPLAPISAGPQNTPLPPGTGANPYNPNEPNWRKNITIFLEIAGLIALIVYTCFAGYQWKVANDTLAEIRNSKTETNRIIAASETQAAAAASFSKAADRIDAKIGGSEGDLRRMASASEQSLRTVSQTDQRAWVRITSIKGITLPASPEALVGTMKKQGYVDMPYSFTVENSGKTPARYMKVLGNYSLSAKPLPWPDKRQLAKPGFLQVIFPGQPGQSYSPPPIRLTYEDGLAWQLGAIHLYIYIVVEYRDIFPNTKLHHTWVCSKFDAFGQQTFCHTGNDAD
jgi:hypothetical protein